MQAIPLDDKKEQKSNKPIKYILIMKRYERSLLKHKIMIQWRNNQ